MALDPWRHAVAGFLPGGNNLHSHLFPFRRYPARPTTRHVSELGNKLHDQVVAACGAIPRLNIIDLRGQSFNMEDITTPFSMPHSERNSSSEHC